MYIHDQSWKQTLGITPKVKKYVLSHIVTKPHVSLYCFLCLESLCLKSLSGLGHMKRGLKPTITTSRKEEINYV